MKKKFIWLIVSCLMVAALVLASCAPAVVEEKKATVVTKEAEKKAEKVEEVVKKVGPQYGGIITGYYARPPVGFDPHDGGTCQGYSRETADSLLHVDWYIDRDLFPLNEAMGYYSEENEASWVGGVAESWERPDDTTLIFHIRKGVYWQSEPPLMGREFVAEDAALYFKGLLDAPKLVGTPLERNVDSVEATGKYTVVFKMKQPWVSDLKYIGLYYHTAAILAPDLWETYGDVRDWRVHRGTGLGPWILEDFVADSYANFIRNPTYWEKDPDGNQLPYADGYRILIIPEMATQVAAIRTGAIDFGSGSASLPSDLKVSMESTNPGIQYAAAPDGGVFTIWPNQSIEPFGDVRVRQALSMGLNRQEINDTLFDGTATTFSWPARHTWPAPVFTPLEELPENIRELYEYHPEKAKQLLVEAGYPNGFEFPIEYWAAGAYGVMTEAMEMIKAYWKENLNVDISLVHTSDWGVHITKTMAAEYPCMATGHQQEGALGCAGKMHRTGCRYPMGRISDSKLDDLLGQAEQEMDATKRNEILAELYLHMAEQMHGISMPTMTNYAFWQPWVKGFNGEVTSLAYTYIWIDQELKKEMTGR